MKLNNFSMSSGFVRLTKYGIIFIIFIIGIHYFFEPFENIAGKIKDYSNFDKTARVVPTKYLTTSRYSGRLGNMMYRCASLYGISRNIDRYPYLSEDTATFKELSSIFPLLNDNFAIISSYKKSQEKVVGFGSNNCCKYELPKILKKYDNVKYLKLSSIYLQSFKFFQEYNTEIRNMFECNQDLRQQAQNEAKDFWRDDFASHKVCAHIRRSDFAKIPSLQESTYEFLYPSLTFIYNNLQFKSKTNVSLLLFGDDEEFARNLTFSNMFTSITVLVNNSRGYDICFAIEYCDTFILSAPSSTFGWWVGYLMKSQGKVYYNENISKRKSDGKVFYAKDTFPQQWIKLKNVKNKTVVVQ